VRKQQDRAAGVVTSKKGALRAAQNLHRVDVEQRRHRALSARDVHAVDVHAHRGIEHDRVAIDGLAAHRDIERRDRLRRGVHMGVRHVAPDVIEQHGVGLPQLLAREHADRDRCLRRRLGTPPRVDDDLLKRAAGICRGRRLRRLIRVQHPGCAGDSPEREPHGARAGQAARRAPLRPCTLSRAHLRDPPTLAGINVTDRPAL
jgi:hypothetical protein